MRRLIFLILFVFLLAGCAVEPVVENDFPIEEPITTPIAPVEEPPKEEPEEPVEVVEFTGTIEGTDEFKQDMSEAIELIKEVMYDKYVDMCKYVKAIKLAKDDIGYFAYSVNDEAVIYFANWYHDADLTNGRYSKAEWVIPVTLVHETTHIVEYDKFMFITAEEQEQKALKAEREFLRALGVDEDLIEEMSGDHWLETRWWED